jgi:AmiR/NasT family two-component response regulator
LCRVLVGSFGAIAGMGLLELLEEHGFEPVSVGVPRTELPSRVAAHGPDAVIVDLESGGAAEMAAKLAHSFESVTIIACSASSPTMCVFPAGGGGACERTPLNAGTLVAAVRGDR